MRKTAALVLIGCLVGQSPTSADAAPKGRAAKDAASGATHGQRAAGDKSHDEETDTDAHDTAAGGKSKAHDDATAEAHSKSPGKLAIGDPTEAAAPIDNPQALAPLALPQPKAGAAEALVGELTSIDGIALEGKPVTLVDLLSRITDRRQQIVVTQAYWKLSAAIAEYQISADEAARVERLLPAAGPDGQLTEQADARLEARWAATAAQLREAEIGVTSAQQDVAQLGDRPPTDPLPLPADRPHAGNYETYFEELYKRQPAPARNYLIDRSLPLRRHSLDMRALAVEAALHAADDMVEPYHQRHVDVSVVLAGFAELSRQRRAFVAAVLQYNDDIAEYALGVAPPGMSAPRLVAMLIGPGNPSPEGSQSMRSTPRGGVERAGFNAAPSPPSSRARGGEPTPARPASESEEADNSHVTASEEPTDEPPATDPFNKQRSSNRDDGARSHVRKPTPDSEPHGAAAASDHASEQDLRLYPNLINVDANARAQRLAASLHSGREAAEGLAAPMSLDDCLAAAVGGNRPRVLEAYWRSGERAAQSQVIDQQIEQLTSLSKAALKFSDQPGGAEAVLRLRAALCSAAADKDDAELVLLADQFLLARLTGRSLGGDWPLPTTVPHAGRYRLHLEALPRDVAQKREVNRLIVGIPAWQEVLVDRAWSVVAADMSRAALTAAYEAQGVDIDEPIAAIQQQSDQTRSFLAAQTEFNRQIAAYVLAVLPSNATDADVIQALVVSRPSGKG